VIIRRITNNLNYSYPMPIPGVNDNQDALVTIPALATDLDLLALMTEDNLWSIQPTLLLLEGRGSITVTGTIDTAGFDYDGVASLHADSNAELRGDVQLVSGTNVTLSQVGQAITISSSGSVTTGNLTDTSSDGITVTGGTGAVVGSGTSLAQHVADTTHNGYLSSTDWNTFNGKLSLSGGTMSGNIDMGKHQLVNAVIQTGTSEPGSPVEGQIFYNTTTHQAELFNGTSWVLLG
jgi:hypothetical protein